MARKRVAWIEPEAYTVVRRTRRTLFANTTGLLCCGPIHTMSMRKRELVWAYKKGKEERKGGRKE